MPDCQHVVLRNGKELTVNCYLDQNQTLDESICNVNCSGYKTKPRMTNNDFLNKMSVDEKAMLIYFKVRKCVACPVYEKCKEKNIAAFIDESRCIERIKQWLESECEVG